MLQLTKTALSGVTVPNAIHKVASVDVDCQGDTIYLMAMLVNASATVPVETKSYSFVCDHAGGNIFDQCYAHAMTLPEYAGATTV
jgi:hypothetical protein